MLVVYDFGETGGCFFLLMEFVDGVNLRQAMAAGKFSPDQALEIVPEVCEALQFAHNEGILHRDIKPENILLDTKGRVKIADFGIAKMVGEVGAPTITHTAAPGTPQYMAPEQIERPAEVDHRADIYSLGVVFYEMLTGELPIGRFAPPSEKSAVGSDVDDIVFRALEKERDRRQQSAEEVRTEISEVPPLHDSDLSGIGQPENDIVDPSIHSGRMLMMTAAGVLFSLLILFLGIAISDFEHNTSTIDADADENSGPGTVAAVRRAKSSEPPDGALFDRKWALAVLGRALEALAESSENSLQFEILKPWLTGDSPNGFSQSAAATELGISVGAVKVAIHRLRKKLRTLVKAEIAQTLETSDEAKISDELDYLIRALS